MGGLVLANGLAQEPATKLAGAMFAGAAFAPGSAISSRELWLIRILRHVLPRATLPFAIDAEALSHDPDEVMAYLSDPLVQPRATVGLAAATLAGMERLSEVQTPIGLPVLVVHGEEDKICAVEAARGYVEAKVGTNAQLRVYPGLRHDLLHERDRAKLFRDLFGWMESLEGNSHGG